MLPVAIVDDSKQDLALLTRVMHQCKILNAVHAFTSGQECIDYFDGTGIHCGRKVPVLLLVDLVMSPARGLDVLRHIQGSKLAGVTVPVMLSGLQDIKAINQGYQLGAVTFLLKPVSVEDVLKMVTAARRLTVETLPDGYVLSTAGAVSPPLPLERQGLREGDTSFTVAA